MAKQTINVGTNQDDGTGDNLRAAFVKVNENFTEIYTELGGTALSNISISGNTISTDNTGGNLILNPNGSGELRIEGNTLAVGTFTSTSSIASDSLAVTNNATIGGGLVVSGTLTAGTFAPSSITVSGALVANGTVDLGDSSADTITATGRFDSALVPSATNTNDIGSASLRWKDIYSTTVNTSGNATVGGNLDVTGNVTIGGNITIGDADTDSININADISSNLIPNADNTFNVGSSTKRYKDIFGTRFLGTSAEIGGLQVISNAIQSVATNSNITINPQGTGIAIVDGQLRVTGTLQVSSSQTIDMGSNRIQSVANPTASTDAANKAYVDSVSGGATGFTLIDDSSTATAIGGGETLAISGSGLVTTSISSNDQLTITVAAQTLDIVTTAGATTANAITVGGVTTDGLNINDNNITSTRSNDNIVLIPNGTGAVEIRSNVTTTGTLNTHTIPSGTDTLVGRATTDTLTNKTINTASNTITIVEADISDLQSYLTSVPAQSFASLTGKPTTVAGYGIADAITASSTDTLTNKTLTNPTINAFTGTGNGSITGNLTVTGSLDTDGISIVDNNISSTRTNDDINLIPGGTGKVVVSADRLQIENTHTPASSVGALGDEKGDFAVDSSYIYYATADYDSVTNIWKRIAWSGDTW
jgi:hypothetical protein